MRSPLLVALALVAPALGAQDVTVHSTNDTRLYGAFGRLVSMATRFGGGGGDRDKNSTMYISGHRMRTESGVNAMVVDLDAEQLMSIDHKQKSYRTMTFAEMARMAQAMQDSMAAGRARSSGRDATSGAKGEVKMDYNVSVDRPKEHRTIAGADAERLFMTVTMRADVTPEGEQTQEAGKLVFFSDEWISRDAAYASAMKEYTKVYAEKLGRTLAEEGRGLQAIFGANPQIKQGLEAAAKERAKLPGVPMLTTLYVAFVPPGMEFDRDRAMNGAANAPADDEGNKKEGGGLRGMMRGLKKVAESASRKGDEPSAPPSQSTIMTMTTEVTSVEKGKVDPSLFAPPAGYREAKRPKGM